MKSSLRNRRKNRQPIPTIKATDIFCGIGGLTHGLVKGGVEVTAGIDIDPDCRFAYEVNNKAQFIQKDILDLTSKELSALLSGAKYSLLAGCAPCQPFSTYSRASRLEKEDKKWELVKTFGKLIKSVRPDFVTMENVPQLSRHAVFKSFLRNFEGYWVWWKIVDCTELGIPQTRKRLVLLASRHGPIELLMPRSQRKKTVRDVIGHLPNLTAGASDPKDSLHSACSLSDLNLKRIRASKPGGSWRDWSKKIVAKCHSRSSGSTFPSVYGRMEWDAPSPTITTQCFGFGNGRFGHPEQDRAISLREAAIIQTFPDDYVFLRQDEKVVFNKLGRLIGNAVPVRLGEIIAKSIVLHAKSLESM